MRNLRDMNLSTLNILHLASQVFKKITFLWAYLKHHMTNHKHSTICWSWVFWTVSTMWTFMYIHTFWRNILPATSRNGGNMFLWNIHNYLQVHTMLQSNIYIFTTIRTSHLTSHTCFKMTHHSLANTSTSVRDDQQLHCADPFQYDVREGTCPHHCCRFQIHS